MRVTARTGLASRLISWLSFSDLHPLSIIALLLVDGRYTSVFPKSVYPVWDEEFFFSGELRYLTATPLHMELYDEDELSRDDALGSADLDLNLFPVFSAEGQEGIEYTLPLSSQGEIEITVSCPEYTPPSMFQLFQVVFCEPLFDLVKALRHFVLYHRMPYDRTFWAKLKDPWAILVMYIAASPDVLVRGLFFTFLLMCIIHDKDEFQLMR